VRRAPRALTLVVLIALTIALGLASRRYPHLLPPFVATYAGDTLWAAALYWLLALLLPFARLSRILVATLTISAIVEISQLYHWTWLVDLRSTPAGALVLGQGFLWSDLACYAAGATACGLIDSRLRARDRLRFGS
jgi:hypothetical protein